eukprot:394377-Alexandrium_andersonii.AAC.1
MPAPLRLWSRSVLGSFIPRPFRQQVVLRVVAPNSPVWHSTQTMAEGVCECVGGHAPWCEVEVHGWSPAPVSYTHLRAHETSAHL